MQLHLNPWTGCSEAVRFLCIQLSLQVPSVDNELSLCSTLLFFYYHLCCFLPVFLDLTQFSHLSLFPPICCMQCTNKCNVKPTKTMELLFSLNMSTVQSNRGDLSVKARTRRGVCFCRQARPFMLVCEL